MGNCRSVDVMNTDFRQMYLTGTRSTKHGEVVSSAVIERGTYRVSGLNKNVIRGGGSGEIRTCTCCVCCALMPGNRPSVLPQLLRARPSPLLPPPPSSFVVVVRSPFADRLSLVSRSPFALGTCCKCRVFTVVSFCSVRTYILLEFTTYWNTIKIKITTSDVAPVTRHQSV